MQIIEQLKTTLQPIFVRHNAEKVFVTDSANDAVLNLYVVGCPRAKMSLIQEEISSALHSQTNVVMNHLESEMLMDYRIRSEGKLLYVKRCA